MAKNSKYVKDGHFIKDFSPNPGDKFEKDIKGVLTLDNYTSIKILPTEELPNIIDIGAKRDVPLYEYDENMLNVVTYNIENYCIFF